MLDEVLNQFADYGLEPAQPLVFGKLTRCKTTQDKGKEKNGWYVVHEHRTEKNETLIFGSFGDWRSGESAKIKVKAVRMSPEERDVMRARQEDAKRKAAEIAANASRRAANRAAGLFKRMPEKGKSAYLDRKQIVGFKVRYAPRTGAFLVPMCNVRDQIVGLQVTSVITTCHAPTVATCRCLNGKTFSTQPTLAWCITNALRPVWTAMC